MKGIGDRLSIEGGQSSRRHPINRSEEKLFMEYTGFGVRVEQLGDRNVVVGLVVPLFGGGAPGWRRRRAGSKPKVPSSGARPGGSGGRRLGHAQVAGGRRCDRRDKLPIQQPKPCIRVCHHRDRLRRKARELRHDTSLQPLQNLVFLGRHACVCLDQLCNGRSGQRLQGCQILTLQLAHGRAGVATFGPCGREEQGGILGIHLAKSARQVSAHLRNKLLLALSLAALLLRCCR
mmetsp:Transcript_124012/g.396834  ORF Transcript_124012/g.396834 Transcript_124012/m.396834 type:complete len:233 (-) Transcript_124012:593-1291(-)